MKYILGAMLTLAAFSASAESVQNFTNGETSIAVVTADNGDVTIMRRPPQEPCGPGELYPCPGRSNPRAPGKNPNLPRERCGSGELYPCPGPANPPSRPGKHPNPPPERCGSGELYPCTNVSDQVNTWLDAEGYVQE